VLLRYALIAFFILAWIVFALALPAPGERDEPQRESEQDQEPGDVPLAI
jgi:hypothetical protein